MSTKTRILACILALIVSASGVVPAPVGWLDKIAEETWTIPEGDSLRLPPDGRIWIVVAFRTCCADEILAIRWAEGAIAKYNGMVAALGVSMEPRTQAGKVKVWAKEQKVRIPLCIPKSGALAKGLALQETPALIILGSKGDEIHRLEWFTEGEIEKLEKIVAEAVAASKPRFDE